MRFTLLWVVPEHELGKVWRNAAICERCPDRMVITDPILRVCRARKIAATKPWTKIRWHSEGVPCSQKLADEISSTLA
jgi:hypothetical protein